MGELPAIFQAHKRKRKTPKGWRFANGVAKAGVNTLRAASPGGRI
jgi:hypothetical protein